MASVKKTSSGYSFTKLTAVGIDLVDCFIKKHPLLAEPSIQPGYRSIRLGSPEQNRLLEELAARVIADDPEIIEDSGEIPPPFNSRA